VTLRRGLDWMIHHAPTKEEEFALVNFPYGAYIPSVLISVHTYNAVACCHIGVTVTNDNGFWIRRSDLLAILYNYNQLWQLTVTVYGSLHSLLRYERLLFRCDERRATTVCSESESESYVKTDGQSASLSSNKATIWGLRPDFTYCQDS
jgi:hypothetical protein